MHTVHQIIFIYLLYFVANCSKTSCFRDNKLISSFTPFSMTLWCGEKDYYLVNGEWFKLAQQHSNGQRHVVRQLLPHY